MIELLLLAGFFYATRDAWAGLFKSYAADKRKGQNELAWWGRELAHGLPHARHPFMNTWRSHQSATGKMREQRLSTRPGEIAERQRLKDAIAEHRRLIAEARQPASQPATTTTTADPPLPADVRPTGGRRHRRQPAGSQPPDNQPAAGPETVRRPLELVDDPPPNGQAPADTGWPGGVQPPPTKPCDYCGRKRFHTTDCPVSQPPGVQPGAGAPPATNATGCPQCGCPS